MDATLDMSAFKHVIVPIGVIIALGVARVVSAGSGYLQHRDRVRFSAAHGIWALVLFLWFVGLWWVVWNFRHVAAELWSFWALVFLLVGPALMFLATTLLLPDLPQEGQVDLADRLEEVARPFCLAFGGVVVWLVWTEHWLLGEAWWSFPKRALQSAILVLFAIGALVPTRRVMLGLGCVALPLLVLSLSTVRAKLG